VDSAHADIAKLVKRSPERLISSLIEERYGRSIARIRQEIEAVNLPPDLAAELEAEAEAGSPALRITRRYIDAAGEVFEISRSIHPGNRFTFCLEMNRARE
jgi:GntR family transcriptional regulator